MGIGIGYSHPLGGSYGSVGQGSSQTYGGSNSLSNQFTGLAQMQAYAAGIAPTCAPSPIPHEGIKLGEIEAWRAWRVHNGFLTALSADLIWAPNEVVEGDIKVAGIHAFKRASETLTQVKNDGDSVIGRVALWGEIVEHENGYRAQFAKPLSLEYHSGKPRSKSEMNALRERYGLPLDKPEKSEQPRKLRWWWR